MSQYRLLVNLFVLSIVFLLVACGAPGDSEGVHGSDGVRGDSSIGADIQTGDASQNIIVIENSGRLVTRSYDFESFDEVEASMFDLNIRQGEKFTVAVEVEENVLDHVRIAVEDGRLKLGLAPGETYNMSNIPLRAQITMPALVEITLDMGSDSTAIGFDCQDGLQKELNLGSSLTCGQGAEQIRFEAEF